MDPTDRDDPISPSRRKRRPTGWLLVVGITVVVMVTATAAFAVARVHSRHAAALGHRAVEHHAAQKHAAQHRAGAPSPEPSIPRELTVVGLGDSVPRAAGCACVSFVTLYGERIAHDTGAHVQVRNLGVNGQTSGGLLAALSPEGSETAEVRRADVVTLTIGANDFNYALTALQRGRCGGTDGLGCFGTTVPSVERNVRAIIERIKVLRAGRPVAIRVTGYWNVFQDGKVATTVGGTAFLRGSDLLTRRVNAAVDRDASVEHVAYVDIYTPFKGQKGDTDDTPLLAPDGDHPSQAGHRLIADALAAAGYSPLG